MAEINPYQPIVEIKEGNEVFRIHKNESGYFLIFGGEVGEKSNLYELSLNTEQVEQIKRALS